MYAKVSTKALNFQILMNVIDAVAAMPDWPGAKPRRTFPPLHTEGRLVWLIDLFADLERRELTRRHSS